MVSQGSLHESDGIVPDFRYELESDNAKTAPTPNDEFTIEDECQADDDFLYDYSGCPTCMRLQEVALGHKLQAVELEADLITERYLLASKEEESQQLLHRISELSTYTALLGIERDNAIKGVWRWKTCAWLLIALVLECPGCERFRRSGVDPDLSVLWDEVFGSHLFGNQVMTLAEVVATTSIYDEEPEGDNDGNRQG